MKLKNKRTGEIFDTRDVMYPDGIGDFFGEFTSLAELNAEWEDVPEEPKEYWYIADNGEIEKDTDDGDDYEERMKEIGNYFETKEEAEKAVEKLKAWKRLKDKGVKLYGWRRNHTGTYDFLSRWEGVPPKMHEIIDDLDLLFGGEE